MSSATAEKLQAAAKKEPADSKARVAILAAATVHAKPEQRASLKEELLKVLGSGNADDKFEACQTLGAIGDNADLPVLTGLLDDSNSDLRATAASAVLRISRRVPHHLGLLDWSVILLYVLGMLAVGWYYSLRTKTQEQYLLGDRQMKPLMVGISMFASLFSCISYLATPGEIIKYGPMILAGVLAYPFVALVIGWMMIPFIMRLKVTSAYEILDLRFGPYVRTLGSTLFLLLRLLWMSVIVYAMARQGVGAVDRPRSAADAGSLRDSGVCDDHLHGNGRPPSRRHYRRHPGLHPVLRGNRHGRGHYREPWRSRGVVAEPMAGALAGPGMAQQRLEHPRSDVRRGALDVRLVCLHVGVGPDRHSALSVHKGRQIGQIGAVHSR